MTACKQGILKMPSCCEQCLIANSVLWGTAPSIYESGRGTKLPGRRCNAAFYGWRLQSRGLLLVLSKTRERGQLARLLRRSAWTSRRLAFAGKSQFVLFRDSVPVRRLVCLGHVQHQGDELARACAKGFEPAVATRTLAAALLPPLRHRCGTATAAGCYLRILGSTCALLTGLAVRFSCAAS